MCQVMCPGEQWLVRQYLHCDSGTLLGLKLNSGSYRIFIPLLVFPICFFSYFILPPDIRYHILLLFFDKHILHFRNSKQRSRMLYMVVHVE